MIQAIVNATVLCLLAHMVGDYVIQALSPENTGKYAVPVPKKLIFEDAAGYRFKAYEGKWPVPGTLNRRPPHPRGWRRQMARRSERKMAR